LPTLSTLHIYFSYNDTATTEIYTLSLHDALPISEATAATAAAAEVTPSQSYREDDDFSSGNLCGNAPLPDTNPVSNRSVQCPWQNHARDEFQFVAIGPIFEQPIDSTIVEAKRS